MGAMTVLFAAFMLGVSARLGASIEESLRLRFSNLRLLRDLSGTNARLEQLNGALEFEVTERRSTQDVLRKSEEKLRLHAQQAPLAFIEWDLNFRAVEWNPAAERIFGWSREDALGRRASHLIAGDGTCDSIARLWQRLLVEKKGARILLDNRTRDGSVIQCEWYYTPLTDRDGRVLSVITLAQDVTASKEAEARLHYLAYHDNLTGLPNRALFADRLQQAMAEARRGGASVGVMLLDVDHFKVVNDTMGHEAGDNLLRDVATRLQQCVRGSDTVARFGGDEFALVLANLPDPANAFTVAQKVLDSFIPPFQVPGGEVYVAASIGIAFFPNDSETLDGLVRDVDSALYHAKAQGRNNFQCYSSDLTARAQVRLATETSLRRALERDEFRLHFQPKVDLGTGRVTGVEALLRWEDRDRGLVPPGDFIALAEDSGLIVPIGEWVLREACAEVRRWDAAGLPPMRLAVNLSSRQFRNQQFGATVDRILAETGFDPSRLEFEITESVLMDQDTRISAILGELKASGIG
ncbi:MAG: diguanylate cyclase, partial [Burkholderiales bacterium]|nr:diguanylate cyclase [Burkholderiales bacterium]